MRKLIALLLCVILLLSLTACGGEKVEPENDQFVVGFPAGLDGIGGQGFTDASYEGIKRLEQDFNTKTILIENKEIADFANNFRTICDNGANVVVVCAVQMADAVKEVAPEYPDVTFIFTDGSLSGFDNVVSTSFREQEAAYLAGFAAGLATKTGKVGYIAGTESSTQVRAINGFEAGFYDANPDGQCTSLYSGTFSDPAKGKEIALQMFNQGSDIVAAFSGAVNTGVFQAAEQMGEGYYAIGAALGQFEQSPEKIILSQVKTIDNVTYNQVAKAIEGTLASGESVLGIKEGGVDLKLNPDDAIVGLVLTDEQIAKINEKRDEIISGKLVPPGTKEEFEAYRK